MCIKKKIAELQKQIDAKLKLKSLLEKTQPVLTSISVICADYRELAPEELPFLMDEILQATQVDLSVTAISAIATTGDEKAQQHFAIDAMTQAIEQRASAAFEVTTEAEGVQQSTNFPPKPEYEPEECTDTLQGILDSRGFYEPDINLAGVYDPEDKQATYKDWDIYCSVHDSGQAMSIGLSNEKLNQFWDVGTEFLADHDPSFPKSLSEKQPILAWVRSVIDSLPEPMMENLEVPGQPETVLTGDKYNAAVEEELALDDESTDLIKEFLITNLPLPHQGMRARVTPVTGGDGKFAGATFTFYRGTEELFSSSQTVDEIARGGNNPELIAVALAESWSQELKNLPPADTTHTELPARDKFTELVYLSDAVASLKRKDTGEVLTGYLGFSNKTPEGDRAPTMAKSRAVKWQEHLVGVYQLACSGPRECQRIESKNSKQPFKYELKLVKPSMGQLKQLATENFGLYPNEVEEKQEGSEAKRELLVPLTETKFSDFEFERATDFDELNPEFSVKYKGEYLTRIWSSLRTAAGQTQRLWRHKLLNPGEEIELKDTEAAALHALQRAQGLV